MPLFGRQAMWSQERIVLALAVLLFAASAIFLPGFLDSNNLIQIVRSVSVLGILAVGMAIVIIGRGIDLAAAPTSCSTPCRSRSTRPMIRIAKAVYAL
jgi:ribose/xylose/arabinose/galactoside ABC-type transport system permease subunit